MHTSQPSGQEVERLAALHRYNILDTAPEQAFDDLTKLAALICGTPIALVGFIDAQRQWVKSRLGLDVAEAPRDQVFCARTIQQADVLILPDTLADATCADSPLIAGDRPVRFYAGAPLVTPDGHAIGSLCVMDYEPRDPRPDQIDALRILGQQVIMQVELRQQASALATMVVERDGLNSDLQHALAVHQSIINTIGDALLVIGRDGRIMHVNRAFKQLWGASDELIAAGDDTKVLDWVLRQLAEPDVFVAKVEELYATPMASSDDVILLNDGRVVERYSHPHIISSVILGRIWGFRDITTRVQAEAAQMRLQDEVIQAQAAALAELSTPLIPLTAHAVLMPLIGSIDSQRAQQVVETLLAGVAQQGAEIAILDITGVPVVDTQVAHALIRAAQAIQLLGAHIVVTGIRPEVAQTLVGLQVEFRGVITRSTLQEGVRYVLGQQARRHETLANMR
jgi:PAS domain S-box-containing protein